MERVLGNIAASVADPASAPKLLAGTGQDRVHLLVVCTAERGLCGAFNSSIVRLAREKINALVADGKTVKILCVGRKGADQLRRQYASQIIEVIELRVKTLGFEHAERVSGKIRRTVRQGRVRRRHAVLLALSIGDLADPDRAADHPAGVPKPNADGAPSAVYEYEPDELDILTELLPRNVAVQVFRALLENAASEQGARMSAMDNATRNAGEMIRKQTITYNRTRQAMITKELIEIISGAEAL